jgi:hypothetical protein
MTYTSAYTDKGPSRDPEIELALTWLYEQRQTDERILVLTPLLENVQHSKVLDARRSEFQFVSSEVFGRGYKWTGDVALALWPTVKMMLQLDERPRLTAVAAIPWDRREVESWVRSRESLDLLAQPEQHH